MAASIWNLRPLQRPVETRHFTDPEQPDWEGITLTLRAMDGPRATRYAVLKTELTRRHITGVRGADGTLEEKPEKVRCLDFSHRTPDELLVDRYAKMAAMWDGEEPCPPLSEMLGWQALLYVGWLDIANWIEEVYTKGLMGALEPEGNAARPATEQEETPAASTATSSEPCSSTTTNTPNSPPEETPSSAPSNGASGPSPGISALTPALATARTAPWPD